MIQLKIPQRIYQEIMETIGRAAIEAGGVLAMEGNTISDYYFDQAAHVGSRFYRPSAELISKYVTTWLQEGKCFCGFIHSHAYPYTQLSACDIVAAERIMLANKLRSIYMAVLCNGTLYFYKVFYPERQKHAVIELCSIQEV